MNHLEKTAESLTTDQFLFSCKQALVARQKKDGYDSHLRYDPFLFRTYKAPKARTSAKFRAELTEIMKHAFAASPQFRRKETIDLNSISFFSLAIATLVSDLGELLKAYTGLELPLLDGVITPKAPAAKLPVLTKAIQAWVQFEESSVQADEGEPAEFTPFPFEDNGDAEADESAFALEFWSLVYSLVRKQFPDHQSEIIRFLNWNFQPPAEPDTIDWHIRPPVGEAFGLFMRKLQNQRAGAQSGMGGRSGPGSSSSGRFERGRGEGGPSGTRRSNGPDRSKGRDARPSRDIQSPAPRSEAGRSTTPLSQEPPQTSELSTEELSQRAIAEVDRNISILRKNSRRPGIRLRPQNSYYRRLQHMEAKERGYETESVGEGKDRCVYIKNKA